MANSPKRVYWDACVWIALIQKEKIRDHATGNLTEDREQMCRVVIEAAKKGKVEIVTSTFCLAEVCKHPAIADAKADKIEAFFEHDYILMVDVDLFVGERARDLMMAGHAGLKPPDSVHLASALITPRIEEMHTFDGRLLGLDGALDTKEGAKLKICKPDFGEPVGPLLIQILNQEMQEPDDQPPAIQ